MWQVEVCHQAVGRTGLRSPLIFLGINALCLPEKQAFIDLILTANLSLQMQTRFRLAAVLKQVPAG